jgi:hypothetical protein
MKRMRTQYLPIMSAEAGMTLAAPLKVINQGHIWYSLPAGHVLTVDNLHQMTVHGAEFIFISEPDTRSDEEVAEDTAVVAGRVMEVFAGADLSNPVMAALFDQVLAYRNA